MTDIERIELAVRRAAQRFKTENRGVFAPIAQEALNVLADELTRLEKERRAHTPS